MLRPVDAPNARHLREYGWCGVHTHKLLRKVSWYGLIRMEIRHGMLDMFFIVHAAMPKVPWSVFIHSVAHTLKNPFL